MPERHGAPYDGSKVVVSVPKLFYVGIKALIRNDQGNILLLLADVSGFEHNAEAYWDLPGGRIEEGDDESSTLKRELREETGITSDFDDETYLHSVISGHQIPVKGTDRLAGLILRIWQVKIPDGSQIILSDEHTEYRWATPQDAAGMLADKYPADFCEYIGALR